jgi:hypothetical protein
MGREQEPGSFIKNAFDAGQQSIIIGRRLGGVAAGAYTGRPPAEHPHITERLRAQQPLNDAQVGKQFVEIGDMFDPAQASTTEQERELAEKQKGYRRYGHSRIISILLQADADPIIEPTTVDAVAEIAHEVGTDPTRLEDTFSEFEIERAKHILDP